MHYKFIEQSNFNLKKNEIENFPKNLQIFIFEPIQIVFKLIPNKIN